MFNFKILKKYKNARIANFTTPHGAILTPAFIPVATKATIKTLDSDDVRKIGVDAVLANTYHLMLQPGSALIKKMGGLHEFMDWQGPIFTDSGGFQVFSLGKGLVQGTGKIRKIPPSLPFQKGGVPPLEKGGLGGILKKSLIKITDDGVWFYSHIDGRKIFMRPEDSIRIQEELGADIIFAFDECTSPNDSREYVEKSMARTHAWAKRSLAAHERGNPRLWRGKPPPWRGKQALFGIVQGGDFKNLREASAKFISSLNFQGFGVGGSFGKKEMRDVLDWTIPLLPENKPHHMLGIGAVEDIFDAVERGIDTFDCVEPTRLGRHGTLLTAHGRLRISSAKFRADKKPVEKNCPCELCANYSRAYLHHLFRADEMLGPRLATIHNLTFMHKLMAEIRNSIKKGDFRSSKKRFLANFG